MSRSLSPWQALILGSAVLVGLSLATLGLFAVGNRQWLWTDTFHLRVGFRQIHGVERGTPVRVFGRNAGEIEDVQMPDSPDGQVTLVLGMNGKLHSLIRTDAFAQIVPVGMVGGKVLEINPGSKEAPVVEDNAVITSRPVNDPIDEAGKVLEALNQEKANVHELVNNTNTLVRQGQKTLASVQQATDAVKRLPGVSSYVEDANELLYRPNCERSPTWFAEAELFAPDSLGGPALTFVAQPTKVDNDCVNWFRSFPASPRTTERKWSSWPTPIARRRWMPNKPKC